MLQQPTVHKDHMGINPRSAPLDQDGTWSLIEHRKAVHSGKSTSSSQRQTRRTSKAAISQPSHSINYGRHRVNYPSTPPATAPSHRPPVDPASGNPGAKSSNVSKPVRSATITASKLV